MNVLLVDDDEITRECICRGFKRAGAEFPIIQAADGREAIEILRGQSPEKRVEQPLIVLLDLNMPRMSGFEFLSELRADLRLRDTAVFVLTTSDDETDKEYAHRLCISGFMVKSQVGPQYSKAAHLLMSYTAAISPPYKSGCSMQG